MDIPLFRKESIPYEFEKFILKMVLRDERAAYYREMSKIAEHEISFSDLPENSYPLSTRDKYFSESRFFETTIGIVVVEDPDIADVISILPDKQREIILLYYIIEKTDKEISETLNISESTIQRHRKKAEQKLKEMLEEKRNEEIQE